MSRKDADALALERVPDVAVEVIVPGKEDAPGRREGDRGDAAEDIVVRVLVQLAVGSQVKQPARSVVRARPECLARREELDRVDVALVTDERLHCLARADVPHLGGSVACSRDKDVLVWPERQAACWRDGRSVSLIVALPDEDLSRTHLMTSPV